VFTHGHIHICADEYLNILLRYYVLKLVRAYEPATETVQGGILHRAEYNTHCSKQEPGSSVSIVSDYGLDDRAIGVRSPTEARGFSSSVCVQTGARAHPASSLVDTGGPLPGGKARPGRD
jgi:hypothetical protein